MTRSRQHKYSLAWRVFAVAASLVLLYFAAGGTLIHKHQPGHADACHICHSAHGHVLAPCANATLAALQTASSLQLDRSTISPADVFSPQRAGRAPPSA